jgi:hypothetical protein
MNINEVRDDRIRTLAATLKKNGLAMSDTQALEMAKSMTTTEQQVNKNFNERKSSMIKNYDVNKPAAAYENPFEQHRPTHHAPSQTWEEEEQVQDSPASQGPAPHHGSYNALNSAISRVQQQFQSNNTGGVNAILNRKTLAEATNDGYVQTETVIPRQEMPQTVQIPVQAASQDITQVHEEPVMPVQRQEFVQAPIAQAPRPVMHTNPIAQQMAAAKVDLSDFFNVNRVK